MTTNVAASIRSRLLNKSKSDGIEFQVFLVRYATERFLYRLGLSSARDRCILKGANLLILWMDEPYRATRDVDFLAFGESTEAAIRDVVSAICAVPCPEDGLGWDLSNLAVTSIRESQRYGGERVRLVALLDGARITLQIDFGFGDVVFPHPEEMPLPTLLPNIPAPNVLVYTQVSAIAEKFEAMVQLGAGNTRMKDFSDIWALSETCPFDGADLREAVARCFERRGTNLAQDTPTPLTQAYYSSAEGQRNWQAHLGRQNILTPPPAAFEQIGERIQAFLGPVRNSIVNGEPFHTYWPPAGPWRRHATGNGG